MKPELVNSNDCTGCGACVAACKHNALAMEFDKNGFLVPKINEKNCVKCGLCEKKCPIINIDKLVFHDPRQMINYTSWSNNDDLCLKSSSGAVFAQLAIDFLNKGNSSVYGAYLKDNNTCNHIRIDALSDLYKILGTKYIQSDASSCYPLVKEDLLRGIIVFFCGTPCQIAGLYSYLNNNYSENLFTAELICHGVNSKLTADMATRFYGARNISSFRDKQNGWCLPGLQRVCFHCTYNGTNTIVTKQNGDYYYRMFASTHRYSCYDCKFTHIERLADITLGDQWGLSGNLINRQKLGASLVLCNTEKGKEIIQESKGLYKTINKNSTLNAYPLFAPAANRWMSISNRLWLYNRLPDFISKPLVLSLWRKNWLVIFRIVLNIFLDKYQRKIINNNIIKTRERYGWTE